MRKGAVVITVALTAVAALMIAHGYVAAATPTPTPVSDNPTCADYGFLHLTKFARPSSGTTTQDGVTITITGSHGDQATEFSWSSATPIDLVIVGANLYAYEEATADTGLVGPDGKGIGHISFCYDIEPPSPSPSPSPSPPPSPPPSPLS
jgi:hypothetical protein